MKNLIVLLLALGLFTFTFSACEKEDSDETIDDEVVMAEDVVITSNLFEDIEDEVEEQIEARGGSGDCPTVTIEPGDHSFPRTITIDYGTDGCEGSRGRLRQGVILATQSDTLSKVGASRTITFNNFFVDGAQVEGVKTITNAGNSTFTRTVSNAKITYPNDEVSTWNASHTLTQTEGGNTRIRLDDVFEVTGSSIGTNRSGVSFSAEIVEPLVKRRNCAWVSAGLRTFTVGDRTRSIDYGDGECDAVATLTLANGRTREIRIRSWWR